MIFRVPGASKNAPRCLRKGLRPAAWLQEGLGRLLGSILARFWPPFWRLKWPWRPLENDIKNKSDFKTILEAKRPFPPRPAEDRPKSAKKRVEAKHQRTPHLQGAQVRVSSGWSAPWARPVRAYPGGFRPGKS